MFKVILEQSKEFKKRGLTKKGIEQAMNSPRIVTVQEMSKHYHNKLKQEQTHLEMQARERQLQAQLAYIYSDEYQKKSPFRPVAPVVELKSPKLALPDDSFVVESGISHVHHHHPKAYKKAQKRLKKARRGMP